jgi:hypothetical protein
LVIICIITLGVAVFGNAPSAVLPATILIAVMGVISAYTFQLIARVCQATNMMSYSEAWDATVGEKTSFIIAFMSPIKNCAF